MLAICGCKSDLPNQIPSEILKEGKVKDLYFETSAANGTNIECIFVKMYE
jgi:hypothetical protein